MITIKCQGCDADCVQHGVVFPELNGVALTVMLPNGNVTLCRKCMRTLNAEWGKACERERTNPTTPPRRHA